MDILADLNPEQRSVVEHGEGPLLVVAGAGTGKTQAITRRIAYLIEHGGVSPSEILALTFTEKAAREMGDRLYALIGWKSFQVPVMTFNAFGAEVLIRFAAHIGRSVRGGLLSSTQKILLLQQGLARLELRYYGPQADPYGFMETVVRYIERLQNAGISARRYREFVERASAANEWSEAESLEQEDLAKLYQLYEEIKQESGTYDYNDQLSVPVQILLERPHLAERLAREYRYFLVDEYQDTSPIQDKLLRLIVPSGGNITAVGDDDQAIYAFRGADVTNILSFVEHFGVKKTVVLLQNYRSGQPVLDAAYRLIQHNNPRRLESQLALDKRLIAQHNDAEVRFVAYRGNQDELGAVVEEVITRLAGGLAPAHIAILARSNATLRLYAKAFRARSIPFALSTDINIFEQRELIHLWHLLEWLGYRASEESIGHVVMGPFICWTATEYQKVVALMRSELLSVEDALRQLALRGDEAAQGLVEKVDEWRSWAETESASRLAYRLMFETGLSERLIRSGGNNNRVLRVFEDLHILLSHMQDYETVSADVGLVGYLTAFPKPPTLEATEAVGDAEGVQLLTIHAAKGLEFETVFVVNSTAKNWSPKPMVGLKIPAGLVAEELDPHEEQRRLMYVAMTRAKRSLFLTAPLESNAGQSQPVSPLIAEALGFSPALTQGELKTSELDNSLLKLQRFYPLQNEIPSGRLPFELANGWIELSVGALETYNRCPHEFYLQYVLGVVSPFGPRLTFGSSLHGAIHAYYEARLRGEQLSLQELESRLDELWHDRGYESRAMADSAHRRAYETLQWFVLRENDVREREVLGTEVKVLLELPEFRLRLRGRIDAYFKTPEGIEIRDFKTGTKRDSDRLALEAKNSFQLRTYALAYEAMVGVVPSTVTLDYIVTRVEGSVALTSRILSNHRSKLGELAERIRGREFAPAPLSEYHKCAAFAYYGEDEEAVL